MGSDSINFDSAVYDALYAAAAKYDYAKYEQALLKAMAEPSKSYLQKQQLEYAQMYTMPAEHYQKLFLGLVGKYAVNMLDGGNGKPKNLYPDDPNGK